ncbi:MAG: hypothetical protein ACI8S6_000489 [Myxococcota bacterium]|jgi:hypothetical protein
MRGALMVMMLAGCRKTPPEIAGPPEDAQQVVASARARTVPSALQASYGIRIDAGSTSGSTRGGMILHPPDQLRIDVLSPLNTPLAYIASDGTALHAWIQQQGTFYRGDDAAEVLDELLGGAVSGADAVAVLSGGLPMVDAVLIDARYDEARDTLRATFEAPQGARMLAWLDDAGTVHGLELAGADGRALMTVDYGEHALTDDILLPGEINVAFPTLGWSIDLNIRSWALLDPVPDVFTLSPPPGAVEADLIERLREAAAKAAP